MARIDQLIRMRDRRVLGRVAYRVLLHLYGLDLPSSVRVGKDVSFPHLGRGTVIHPKTEIGDNVTIFHGVTVGRADAHRPEAESKFQGVVIESGAVLMTGCVGEGGPGVTVVGSRSIVAANAVLRTSTGEAEVWAGVPAKRIQRGP